MHPEGIERIRRRISGLTTDFAAAVNDILDLGEQLQVHATNSLIPIDNIPVEQLIKQVATGRTQMPCGRIHLLNH